MTVEIGASPLSPEQVFELMHLNAHLLLDNSYAQREQAQAQPIAFEFEPSNKRDFALLCAILRLANSDGAISVEDFNEVIERFQDNCSLCGNLPVFASQLAALRLSCVMRFADKLLPIAFSLFLELSSAGVGFLTAVAGRAGRSLADEIRTYTANSKRANAKKQGDSTQFASVQRFREIVQALSPIAREQLRLDVNALTPPGADWLEAAADAVCKDCVAICVSQMQFIESLKAENGVWKPAQPGTFEEFVFSEQDGGNAPERLIHLLCQQIYVSLSILRQAREQLKKGSLPVGMGVLQLLDHADVRWDQLNDSVGAIHAHLLSALSEILSASTAHRVPLPPSGTRDLTPNQTFVRAKALRLIRAVFQSHSAVEVETPTFESRQVLLGKYGEDEKLIYNIEDFGEEPLSLRYDLTVPFARFCATNGVREIKRYEIGRVYRRDKPVIERGRFREFYQCDFDIAGEYAPMAADAEVLCVAYTILHQMELGFYISVNDRRVLDAAMNAAGVPKEKFRGVCACIDALDKISVEECRKKLIYEKGLTDEVCDAIFRLIKWSCDGPTFPEMLTQIEAQEPEFSEAAQQPLQELALMLRLLQKMNMGACKAVKIDFSLARGLDYYTGMVFEAKLTGEQSSIAGGGRYDGLLGQTGGQQVPAVGGSIGIERIFALLENKNAEEKQLDCYITACPGGSLEDRLEIAGMLWEEGIKAGVSLKDSQSLKALKRDLEDAVASGCQFCLIRGGDEIEKGVVGVKNLATETQVDIPVSNFVVYVVECLGKTNADFKKAYFRQLLLDVKEGKRTLDDALLELQ